MKPAQIIFLIGAGALGGAVLTTTMWHKPQPPRQVAAADVQQPAMPPATAPAVQQPPAAAPAAPEPVSTEPEKPSPVQASEPPKTSPAPPEPRKAPPVAARPRREEPLPHPVTRHAPPPANPRPVETARVEPKTVPVPVTPPASAPVAAPTADPAPNPPARPEPERVAPAPPPPPAPAPNRVTLNSGLLLPVRLIDGLSSERNLARDTFTGTLDKELDVDGFVIAERGARVDGRVINVDRGGKVRGVASMAIELTRIHTSDGQAVPIQTDAFERHAEASGQTDAAKVGAGAAVGAIIGAIAGGGKGAAIGAGVGGGAGAGDVLLTRGKPVTFSSETRVSFRLRAPVTITEQR